MELGDNEVGRVDSNLNSLSIDLLARDLLDVDDILGARDEGDLSFLGLVLSDADEDLVVLADGRGANTELGAQVLRERSAHADATLAGGSVEVSLALLSAGRRNICAHTTTTTRVSLTFKQTHLVRTRTHQRTAATQPHNVLSLNFMVP